MLLNLHMTGVSKPVRNITSFSCMDAGVLGIINEPISTYQVNSLLCQLHLFFLNFLHFFIAFPNLLDINRLFDILHVTPMELDMFLQAVIARQGVISVLLQNPIFCLDLFVNMRYLGREIRNYPGFI